MTTNNPLDVQVGGDHYKRFKIQPIEFIMANGLGFIEGNIIKYACRHQFKDGAKDVKKVIHYGELLLALNYKEGVEAAPAEPKLPKLTLEGESKLEGLARLLKTCLELHGEDAVEEAIRPTLDEWEAKKPKDEEPEAVFVPGPEVPYVQEPVLEEAPSVEAHHYQDQSVYTKKKKARYEN